MSISLFTTSYGTCWHVLYFQPEPASPYVRWRATCRHVTFWRAWRSACSTARSTSGTALRRFTHRSRKFVCPFVLLIDRLVLIRSFVCSFGRSRVRLLLLLFFCSFVSLFAILFVYLFVFLFVPSFYCLHTVSVCCTELVALRWSNKIEYFIYKLFSDSFLTFNWLLQCA